MTAQWPGLLWGLLLVPIGLAAYLLAQRRPRRFRVGVVSFADSAEMLIQPTTDREAVYGVIAALRAEGGTAMGDGLERALDAKRSPRPTAAMVTSGFPRADGPPPRSTVNQTPLAVLLLSDGASNWSGTQR